MTANPSNFDPSALFKASGEDPTRNAERLLQEGRIEDAMLMLERILDQDPENTAALHKMGLALLNLGRFAMAAEKLEQAAKQTLDDPEIWAAAGYSWLALDDTKRAIAPLQRARELDPASPRNAEMLADALSRGGRTEEAEQLYRDMIQRFPDEGIWQGRLGILLERRGNIEEAIALLRQATGKLPRSFDFNLALFRTSNTSGDNISATASLERCGAIIKNELKTGEFDAALDMEAEIADHTGSTAEPLASWSAAMAAAAQRLPRPPASHGITDPAQPVAGFFLRRGSWSPAVERVMAALEQIDHRQPPPFQPRLYVLSQTSQELRNACDGAGIALTDTDRDWPGNPSSKVPYQRLLWLRGRIAGDRARALIWIDDDVHLAFAAALCMAPLQIHLTMATPASRPDAIDCFLPLSEIPDGGSAEALAGELVRLIGQTAAA
jgi:pentatricopeptide repeat protein